MHRDRGATVVLTTHYLEEADALATRVAVVHQGRRLAEGTASEIRAQVGQSRISYRGEAKDGLPGVARIECTGDEEVAYAHDADAAVRALVLQSVPFSDLQVRRANLEEAFVAITGAGG